MFEVITDNDERGQVGIGTLIVFIAMVLVAAIAAGVLINTAGSLQSQASDTGSETQEAVANQIEVVHAVGYTGEHDSADHAESDEVGHLDLTVKKSAGSDVIDLTSATIQYTSETADATLSYADSDDWSDGDSTETSLDDFVDEEHDDVFATIEAGQSPADEGDSYAPNEEAQSLTNTDDRVIVRLDIDAIENGGDPDTNLGEGDSATVSITDQSGAQYTYGVTTPPTFTGKEVVTV
ncbi:archaellin/type IV pilin N-terminal domain-containing protein [Natronococcus sp.]|uniref:archaellin/type IV pilin N-terminal domain-containing protein n=1 Tax=Natronococcus sp. TaxID=35747 RepID=UPI0025F2E2F1|nr:archaellin/type IV pilin N-terminal domain-containing protein [Natronococcus sp.]